MQLQSMPATTTTTCTAPSITPTGLSFANSNNTNYPMQVQFMADLVAAAVICGKARAVTMDLIDNGGGNSLTFPWLSISSPDFHAIAHKGSADYVNKTKIDQWFWQACVARVVSKLAGVTEGSGTVLDNTVILVSNDMSEGSFHDVRNIPYVIIGSGGGFFKTGRMVTLASNVPNNHLLTSVLHALGMTSVTGVGDSKYAGNLDSRADDLGPVVCGQLSRRERPMTRRVIRLRGSRGSRSRRFQSCFSSGWRALGRNRSRTGTPVAAAPLGARAVAPGSAAHPAAPGSAAHPAAPGSAARSAKTVGVAAPQAARAEAAPTVAPAVRGPVSRAATAGVVWEAMALQGGAEPEALREARRVAVAEGAAGAAEPLGDRDWEEAAALVAERAGPRGSAALRFARPGGSCSAKISRAPRSGPSPRVGPGAATPRSRPIRRPAAAIR